LRLEKPSNAVAIEQLHADGELSAKFGALPDIVKWEWLAFSCKNPAWKSLKYARELVNQSSER
jgi:hypothetical protein